MSNKEEIRKQKEKRKKILIIAVGSVVGIFVLFGIVSLILSGITGYLRSRARAEIDSQVRRYVYPEPDYDFNIFEDDGYMALDRNVWYNDSVMKTIITEESYKNCPAEIQFMYNVVNLIIKGDYIEYNKIFTDNYLKKAGDDLREWFTMQQLFEIELEYAGASDIIVTYRIRNNNGTFRNDLDYNDNCSLPVVYRLVYDGAEIKVGDLLTYYKYTTGLYD